MGIFADIFTSGILPHDTIEDVSPVDASECDNGFCAASSVSRTLALPCTCRVCPNCINAMNAQTPECPECEVEIDRLWALTNVAPLWDDSSKRNALLKAHYKAGPGWSDCSCGGGAPTNPAKNVKATCLVCRTEICTYHGSAHEGSCEAESEKVEREGRWNIGGVPCCEPECRTILRVDQDDCDAVICPTCRTMHNLSGGDAHTHSHKYSNTRKALDSLKPGTSLKQIKGMLAGNALFDELFKISDMIKHLGRIESTEDKLGFLNGIAFAGLRDCLIAIVNDEAQAALLGDFDAVTGEDIEVDLEAEFYEGLEAASDLDTVFNLLDDNQGEAWVDAADFALYRELRSEAKRKILAQIRREAFEVQIDVAGKIAAIGDAPLKRVATRLMTGAGLL